MFKPTTHSQIHKIRAKFLALRGVLLGLTLSFSSESFATSYRISHKENNEFWGFGTSFMQYNLESDDNFNNDILGTAFQLSFSRGAFRGTWAYQYGLDFTTGPYQKSFDDGLNMDSVGFGINSQFHYLVGSPNIREDGVKFVLTGGGSVSFIDADSVGTNQNISVNYNSPENDGIVNSYSIRGASFSVMLGAQLLSLKTPRPLGNAPELLRTRVEGYAVGIIGYVPLANYYEAKQGILQQAEGQPLNVQSNFDFTGSLKGYSVLLSITTYISG